MSNDLFLSLLTLLLFAGALLTFIGLSLIGYAYDKLLVLIIALRIQDSDKDLDTRYEENRQIINPIEDDPFR